MDVPRCLRPAILQAVAGELWAVDVLQPVTAVLDPSSGVVRRLLSWPSVPPAPEHQWQGEWRARSDGEALWVQAGAGPVARVTPDGEVTVATVRTTTDTQPHRLTAAGPHGAWLVPDAPVQDITPTADAPPPTRGWSRLLLAGADGPVRSVVVEHPVLDVVGTGSGTALAVDTGRGTRRDLGASSWSWEPDPTWLLIPDDRPVPDHVSAATVAEIAAPPVRASARSGDVLFMWHLDTLPNPEGRHEAPAEPAGGLLWRAGWDGGSDSFERRSIATGHDPATGALRHRVDLGHGAVRALVGTPDALFVSMVRPGAEGLYPFVAAPAAVLAIDPAEGTARELLGPDSVDVSGFVRPLGRPPSDADSYVGYWARYWGDDDGAVAPLTERMRNARVEVTGAWPETALEITFAWVPLPGWRLRRRLRLFDELGRPTPPEYSDVHLGEDLATGGVPPAPAGRTGGVLDL